MPTESVCFYEQVPLTFLFSWKNAKNSVLFGWKNAKNSVLFGWKNAKNVI